MPVSKEVVRVSVRGDDFRVSDAAGQALHTTPWLNFEVLADVEMVQGLKSVLRFHPSIQRVWVSDRPQ